MSKPSLLTRLQDRGRVHDVSQFGELDEALRKSSITFYCGFDPTADSLHVGSMLPLVIMRELQRAGHKPIVLLGSATGMIGDPSGKSEERVLLTKNVIEKNLAGIEKQIAVFLSSEGKNAVQIVRNDTWLSELSYIEFLRDVGKLFSVNAMIAKESVKTRLENREQGISYTEFSYMLLQAYDFYHLNAKHDCLLQVGGSDQWGNITAGIELVRRRAKDPEKPVFGLTFPLLTTSSGQKFGKTAEGAVWLNPAKTSPYRFYQYWYNSADEDVIRFLELFTEIDDEELDSLKKATRAEPQARTAQKRLAQILTDLVHDKTGTKKAETASSVLFGQKIADIDSDTLLDIFSDVPSTELTRAEISKGISLHDLLVKCKLAQSKGAARRLLDGGGVYLNNERAEKDAPAVTAEQFVEEKVLVLRSGKKNYHLVHLV